jgi:hypothetical protein
MTTTRFSSIPLVLAFVSAPALADVTQQHPPAAPPAKEVEKKIDPEADRLLRQMTDYVSSLKSFKVDGQSSDEVVTKDGHKFEVVSESQLSVTRPNMIKSEKMHGTNAMTFTDDGKSMTLHCKTDNTYATQEAPGSLDETIDKLRKDYQVDAPGADLLYSNPYDALTEQVTAGQVIGKEYVNGVPTNHLAFQGEEVDWQIWIQDGAQPLPMRYVITTKTMKNEPEFTLDLSHWQPQAKLGNTAFVFHPPAGAKKVDAFPTNCGMGK